jgi:hypothetical protein
MARMDLTKYVKGLQDQLAVAADAGDESSRELAERLIPALDAAVRLVLLDALSNAADEITRELVPGSVEVRLRGGEPDFVVSLPPSEDEYEDSERVPDIENLGQESETTRLNLRLPETLKQRIEEAAGAEGLSLNAWLVRAAASALSARTQTSGRRAGGGERFTGWVS